MKVGGERVEMNLHHEVSPYTVHRKREGVKPGASFRHTTMVT